MEILSGNDMVIYYPYFVAVKSGVIDVSCHRTVIEAVKKDLWNLVTHNERDVTIIFTEENLEIFGDDKFLSQDEIFELIKYSISVRKTYESYMNIGKSVLLEWSLAQKSDKDGIPIGDKKIVFYEIRTV